jgi:hypothetical protein
MDTATAVIAVASVGVGEVFVLLGLWLRLRWQVRNELIRHQYLTSVIEAVAKGGLVELDHRGEAHKVCLKITPVSVGRQGRAA